MPKNCGSELIDLWIDDLSRRDPWHQSAEPACAGLQHKLWVAVGESRQAISGVLEHVVSTRVVQDQTMGKSRSKRMRVIALLNAISDLHEGDLHGVLTLDALTPIMEFGEDATFSLREDGTVAFTPRIPPAPESLKRRVPTGEQLGQILEAQLMSILVFGEGTLRTVQKKPKAQLEMGGRQFV
jgi:hypothetical protein